MGPIVPLFPSRSRKTTTAPPYRLPPMPEVREYKIDVPQAKIDRLMKKLDDVEWPTELENEPGWDFGSPL